MAEQAAQGTFALFTALAAIAIFGLEVDAFALAVGLARGAAHAALPVRAAGCCSVRGLAHRLAITAMVQISARVDAGRRAGDEWQLAAELTLTALARGR